MTEERATSTAWTEAMAERYLSVASSATTGRTDDATGAWLLALTIMRQERPATREILDVASGPGGFLATALEVFPEAHGTWFDFSEAMRSKAMANLAAFGPRVRFELGDFSEIDKVGAPGSLDVILTARASHHLSEDDLATFYRDAASLLAPGGWCANLDIMEAPGEWDARLRRARDELRARNGLVITESHPHPNPFPPLEVHTAALRDAGFEPPHEIWRSSVSSLVLARRAS